MQDPMFSQQRANGNHVETTSAFRMWWLKNWHGYRVVMVRRTPELGSFGRIRYRVFWLLEPNAARGD